MVLALSLATGILLLVHLISLLIASLRLARGGTPAPAVGEAPPVSIVIPENGIEPYSEETIARAFRLDWPHYELIFCLADPKDPLIPSIRAAMAAQPDRPAQILTGDDRISANPKLNNCVKGWLAARHDWVILADSNVLMPQDYIRHLMAAWRPNTGLVCSTPIGARPHGFWAEVECMFLNSHQARWQYAGEALGWGFAQGKSMLWHKPMLDANGGIHALGAEIAEDAASTKLVSRLGLKVHLVSAPSRSRLALERSMKSGRGSDAGRGCVASLFRLSSYPKSSSAPFRRSPSPLPTAGFPAPRRFCPFWQSSSRSTFRSWRWRAPNAGVSRRSPCRP